MFITMKRRKMFEVDLRTKYNLPLDWMRIADMVSWCKDNCKHDWDDPVEFKFIFEDEQDAVFFKLTWG